MRATAMAMASATTTALAPGMATVSDGGIDVQLGKWWSKHHKDEMKNVKPIFYIAPPAAPKVGGPPATPRPPAAPGVALEGQGEGLGAPSLQSVRARGPIWIRQGTLGT